MNTLLVSYDLNRTGQNYAELIEVLKRHSAWWHHLDSTWLIETDDSAVTVRNNLKHYIDSNDELLVINVTDDARAWTGFNAKGSQWLKDSF